MSTTTTPLKIAIIQLTRIGDIVQTVQAARQFRAENPNTHLTLIARRKFAAGILFLIETVFDETCFFDTQDFIDKDSLSQTKTHIGDFLKDLNTRDFDVTVNLSFSKSSSYLNSFIQSKLTLGMERNQKSEIVINDRWSQFVYSNVMNTTQTPFSLVDIYRNILGCQEVHTLSESDGGKREKIITLHPFASHKKKRWGISKWIELIYKLNQDRPDHTIHIVGGSEDQEDSHRILSSPALSNINDRLVSHVGLFSLSDTYQLLSNSKLFIGHDSVVSHLASETLTKSIVISLGTVRPFETTAYSDKVVNLAPRNKCFPCFVSEGCELLPCHNSIGHQAVSAIANGLIEDEEISYNFLQKSLSPFQLDSINVYSAWYNQHGLDLTEVSANDRTLPHIFQDFYKVIWQYYFREHEVEMSLPKLNSSSVQQLNSYKEGVNHLFDLYNFGAKFSNRIIEECEKDKPSLDVIKKSIQQMTEIDQLCQKTKKSYPLLSGLVDYFFVMKSNADGENILDVSKTNLLAYHDASNLVAILDDFIEKSTSPHLIKPILKQEL